MPLRHRFFRNHREIATPILGGAEDAVEALRCFCDFIPKVEVNPGGRERIARGGRLLNHKILFICDLRHMQIVHFIPYFLN